MAGYRGGFAGCVLQSITVAKVTDVPTYKSDNDAPLEESPAATFAFKEKWAPTD